MPRGRKEKIFNAVVTMFRKSHVRHKLPHIKPEHLTAPNYQLIGAAVTALKAHGQQANYYTARAVIMAGAGFQHFEHLTRN